MIPSLVASQIAAHSNTGIGITTWGRKRQRAKAAEKQGVPNNRVGIYVDESKNPQLQQSSGRVVKEDRGSRRVNICHENGGWEDNPMDGMGWVFRPCFGELEKESGVS